MFYPVSGAKQAVCHHYTTLSNETVRCWTRGRLTPTRLLCDRTILSCGRQQGEKRCVDKAKYFANVSSNEPKTGVPGWVAAFDGSRVTRHTVVQQLAALLRSHVYVGTAASFNTNVLNDCCFDLFCGFCRCSNNSLVTCVRY
jgi:hypothetical protein